MQNAYKILIAVPESDSHVVAAKLLEFFMRSHGYEVVNLGANTSAAEIAEAAEKENPIAILISSQNGHAHTDLMPLAPELLKRGLRPLVIAGGKLSLNPALGIEDLRSSYRLIGVDVAAKFSDALAKIQALNPIRREALNAHSS